MKNFHIVITDNETSETLYESDATGIIGAINRGDSTTAALSLVRGGPKTVLETLKGVEKVKEEIYKEHPELKLIELILGVEAEKIEKADFAKESEEPATENKCTLKNLFKKGDK